MFFTRTGLVDVDPRTGAVRSSFRWRPRINASVNAAAPVVHGDIAFVTTSYGRGGKAVPMNLDGVGAAHDRFDGVDLVVHASGDGERGADVSVEDRQPAQPQQQLR